MAIQTKTNNKNMAILIISIIGINLFLAIETRQNHFISYFEKINFSFWRKFRHFPLVLILKHALANKKLAPKLHLLLPFPFLTQRRSGKEAGEAKKREGGRERGRERGQGASGVCEHGDRSAGQSSMASCGCTSGACGGRGSGGCRSGSGGLPHDSIRLAWCAFRIQTCCDESSCLFKPGGARL